jgi:superfamily II DNA/RNA helicase
VENLEKDGVRAAAIHGNKSQNARERALAGFKEGQLRVLVATDIAARGIDIDGLSHVINFELPNIPETYVHRIGRTGRAGAEGRAFSFCDEEEREFLVDIESCVFASLSDRSSDFNALGFWSKTISMNLPVMASTRSLPPPLVRMTRPMLRSGNNMKRELKPKVPPSLGDHCQALLPRSR